MVLWGFFYSAGTEKVGRVDDKMDGINTKQYLRKICLSLQKT